MDAQISETPGFVAVDAHGGEASGLPVSNRSASDGAAYGQGFTPGSQAPCAASGALAGAPGAMASAPVAISSLLGRARKCPVCGKGRLTWDKRPHISEDGSIHRQRHCKTCGRTVFTKQGPEEVAAVFCESARTPEKSLHLAPDFML